MEREQRSMRRETADTTLWQISPDATADEVLALQKQGRLYILSGHQPPQVAVPESGLSFDQPAWQSTSLLTQNEEQQTVLRTSPTPARGIPAQASFELEESIHVDTLPTEGNSSPHLRVGRPPRPRIESPDTSAGFAALPFKELSEQLDIDVRWLRRLAKQGRIKTTKVGTVTYASIDDAVQKTGRDNTKKSSSID